MTCNEVHTRLSEYLEHLLDEESSRSVQSHLSSCPRCRSEAEALAQSIRSVSSLPPLEPPPGFAHTVMARVREETSRPSLWARLFLPIRIKVPLHAMALLLIGVFSIYLYQTSRLLQTDVGTLLPPQDLSGSAPSAAPPSGAVKEKQYERPDVAARIAKTPAEREQKTHPSPAPPERRETAQPEPAVALSQRERYADAPTERAPTPSRSVEESRTTQEFLAAPRPVNYELVLQPREPFEGMAVLEQKLRDLVKRVGGDYVSPTPPQEPQTFWISLPPEQYGQLKRELAALGKIASESRLVSSLAPAPLHIKLTILPLQKPERTLPAEHPAR